MTSRARNKLNSEVNDLLVFYSGLKLAAARPDSNAIAVEAKTLVVTESTISVCANGRRWNYNRKSRHLSSEDIAKTT